MAYAVRFERVTKRYPRGRTEDGSPRYASLRYDLALVGRRRKQHVPLGVCALEDVSFEVGEGESFALLGANGAGKSTALKLVSRISYPTSGTVRVRGRVASLIEVGSGVHAELTARENIWLYGRILGLDKPEIARRFDEIVEFGELADAIDTPTKFFSSGMQLRLDFSIAVHLDPDVFVVDEALAVGDAGFQTKCIERMGQLVRGGGTLLVVSHNLFMVEAVCDRALLLDHGRLVEIGTAKQVLADYIEHVDAGLRNPGGTAHGSGVDLDMTILTTSEGDERYVFRHGEGITIRLRLQAEKDLPGTRISIGLTDGRQEPLVVCSMLERPVGQDLWEGGNDIECRIAALPLAPRIYEVWASVRDESGTVEVLEWRHIASFRIRDEGINTDALGGTTLPWTGGPVRVEHTWHALSPQRRGPSP